MGIDTRTWIRVWKEVHEPYFDDNGRLPKDWGRYWANPKIPKKVNKEILGE